MAIRHQLRHLPQWSRQVAAALVLVCALAWLRSSVHPGSAALPSLPPLPPLPRTTGARAALSVSRGAGGAATRRSSPALPGCRIPRIIHQTWKSARVRPAFAQNIEAFVRRNPGWEYRFWTDADNRQLVKDRFPDFLPVYDGYKSGIQRADAVRYLILSSIGGVYADLDFRALRSLEPLVANFSCVLGQEPWEHSHLLYDRDRMMCNAFMASCPDHELWKTVVEELVERRAIQTVRATGPKMLEAALEKFGKRQQGQTKGVLEASLARGVGEGQFVVGGSSRYAGAGAAKLLAVSAAAVYVAPSWWFYPVFDEKNEIVREKCEADNRKNLSERQKKVCRKLQKTDFLAPPHALCSGKKHCAWPSRPFAAHQWTHTWLSGDGEYEEQDELRKVSDVVRAAQEKVAALELFRRFDEKNRHKLGRAEFEKVIVAARSSAGSDSYKKHIKNSKSEFKKADSNGSGSISFAEFFNWWQKHTVVGGANYSKQLAGSAACQQLEQRYTKACQLQMHFEKHDANRDESVNWREFYAMALLDRHVGLRESERKKADEGFKRSEWKARTKAEFAKADADGDGRISRAELAAWFALTRRSSLD